MVCLDSCSTEVAATASSGASRWNITRLDSCSAGKPNAMGRPEAVRAMLANVLLSWPDPEYLLILNPGSPLGATVGGEDLRRLLEFVDSLGDSLDGRALPGDR